MNEEPSTRDPIAPTPAKGRGAASNRESRYSATHSETVDDGWTPQERMPLRTTVTLETSRRIISRNVSPDIPFEQSINPYRWNWMSYSGSGWTCMSPSARNGS